MEITQGLRDRTLPVAMSMARTGYLAVTMGVPGLAPLFASGTAWADGASAFGPQHVIPASSPALAFSPLWLALGAALAAFGVLTFYISRLRRQLADEIRLRQQAHDQARRLASALDQTAEVVMITDSDGRIEYVNPTFTHVTGYSADEVRGRTPAILRSGMHNAEFYSRLWETIRRGKMFQDDVINRRKDGTLFYGRMSILPVRDAAANSTYFISTLRDLTQQRLVEEETRKRDEQVAHTARLNIIGEMVANLAHELSQPLTAIINYAHGCVRRALAPDAKPMQLIEPLKQIVAQGQRTAAVVQHLREFVANREPQRASADLNQLVAQAASLAVGEARKRGVHVALELSPNLPPVNVDGIQIEQVVLHLVRNGAEALASADESRRELKLRTTLNNNDEIETSVSDTGPGLPPPLAAKLFEPFFSTKPNGIGLGLAISRNIVEAHGGKLWVTPNDDRGVTFHFTVPVETQIHGSGDCIRS
jgi:two-component system, LuxR family, sensor kinase FixL